MSRGKSRRHKGLPDAGRLTQARTELAGLAAIEDPNERLLESAAIIQRELLEVGVSSVLVGGLAVAYWTSGLHVTGDIDVLMPTSAKANALLQELGFTRHGRMWALEELEIEFEAPGWAPSENEEIVEIETPGDRTLKILGLEDILIWRLREFVVWEAADSFHHVCYLLETPALNRARLERRAEEEGLASQLQGVEQAFAEQKKRDKAFESWELHDLAKKLCESYSQRDDQKDQ
jgi:hypothetical protein